MISVCCLEMSCSMKYCFRTIQPMEYMGNHYFVLKNQVIKAERRILKVPELSLMHESPLLN